MFYLKLHSPAWKNPNPIEKKNLTPPHLYPNHHALDVSHSFQLGYEPAGLTMHPPPKTIEGGFIFFA